MGEHSHLKTKCSRNVVIEQAIFKITVLESHWCEQMSFKLGAEKGSIERDCRIIDFSCFCEGLSLLISSESLPNLR